MGLVDTVSVLYEQLKNGDLLVPVLDDYEPGSVHAGLCKAFIGAEHLMAFARTGQIARDDCAAAGGQREYGVAEGCVCEGSQKAAPEGCGQDGLADRRRDCQFEKVGDVLFSVHTGWPVARSLPKEHVAALSWYACARMRTKPAHACSCRSVVEMKKRGRLAMRQRQFESLSPVNMCVEQEVDEGLQVFSLLGSAAVSAVLALIGISIDMGQRHSVAVKKMHLRPVEDAKHLAKQGTAEAPQYLKDELADVKGMILQLTSDVHAVKHDVHDIKGDHANGKNDVWF